MVDLTKVGRIAFRHEGDLWNAYYALPDTMDGALHLGSIRMGAVAGAPAAKQAFIDLMRLVVANIMEGQTGARPEWNDPEIAPEHERAGHS